jgi:putative hydrolase of the HAD superfamily
LIYIFDLDDTLYPEIEFAKSGFRVVAEKMSHEYGIKIRELADFLNNQILEGKRFQAFQNMIEYFQLPKSAAKIALSSYRAHTPSIYLYPEAEAVLKELKKNQQKIYIVTDGNKIVQSNKIRALDLEKYVQRSFVTHQHGLKNAKPSLHCFNLIKKIENRPWTELIYIGDNPSKDFKALNLVGGLTIQVNQGPHSSLTVPTGFNAKYRINSLGDLPRLIKEKGFN